VFSTTTHGVHFGGFVGKSVQQDSMVQGVRGIGKRTIREGHHNLELSSFPIRLNESQRLSQTSKEEERHMLLADL